jgi:hypothetical protein
MPVDAALDPAQRALYADILRAPAGFRLDAAVATTYSLDFETALVIPAALAFHAAEERRETLGTPLALLDGLERMARRIAIFCEAGRIHGRPSGANRLTALLEDTVTEVLAPRGGAFHPKLWALRFLPMDGVRAPCMRLAILSRNLTTDASWDLSLCLDGEPQPGQLPGNAPLRDLIAALPGLSIGRPTPPAARAIADSLAADVARTRWAHPEGVDALSFATAGLGGADWFPPVGDRLGVISPFVTEGALRRLTEGMSPGDAILLSRSEELDTLAEATLARFGQVRVLKEMAETEDGEDPPEDAAPRAPARGLHAKAFVTERRGRTTITMGSGNATRAALLDRTNVEVFAVLTGPTRRLGGVEAQMGDGALGPYLEDYIRRDTAPTEAERAAERRLDTARRALARADLRLSCSDGPAGVALALWAPEPVALCGATMRAWPITRTRDDGTPLMALGPEPVLLGRLALRDVTRWIGIALTDPETGAERLFSLGATLQGLPERRMSKILRSVIENRDAFLRYLRLLLGEEGEMGRALMRAGGGADLSGLFGGPAEDGVLEDMVRALSGDGRALEDVARLIDRLGEATDDAGNPVIPEEFRTLWAAFEALDDRKAAE